MRKEHTINMYCMQFVIEGGGVSVGKYWFWVGTTLIDLIKFFNYSYRSYKNYFLLMQAL